ncbi:MAG: PAS domain-containing protein [Burkholderiales bacterium]
MRLLERTERMNNHVGSQDNFAALILDEHGMILECNQAAEKLLGYPSNELILHHVSMLLPQLEEGTLIKGDRINPKLKFMCHCGQLFRVLDRQCQSFFSELHLVELSNRGGPALRAILCPANQ